MLSVRFDIVFPCLGSPTQQIDEKTYSLVFSVNCNIFFGTSVKKSQKIPTEEKKDSTTKNGEVEYFVQYFIQQIIITNNNSNSPKKGKNIVPSEITKFRFPQQSSEKSPIFKNQKKPISFLVGKKAERVYLSKTTKLPLGQLSHLLLTPKLQSVTKIGIPEFHSLSQPALQIPFLEIRNSVEPQFVQYIRNFFSENPSDDLIDLCEEGVGGTYFIHDNHNPVAVFKPSDEEPGAKLNPKKKLDKPILPPGGGALREYAAYLLDEGHHAGVPETFLIENIRHRKMSNGGSDPIMKSGSLQRYIPNKGNSLSMSPSLFSVEDVHAIAILDLRTLNLDRNGENILLTTEKKKKKKNEFRLVPIDHTYILPPSFDCDPFFEWHFWRQTKVPMSPETRSYIAEIDPERDAERLRRIGIDEKSIRIMKISTLFLQMGSYSGLTLFDIANFFCRKRNKKKSELSEMVSCAENNTENDFWKELTILIEKAVLSIKK